jgi:hypothetical protein
MPGVYGGLIVILIYSSSENVIDKSLFLITQGGDPILTNTGDNILVTEEE